MVDTSIIMQAARQPDVNLPDILQRSAESAAAIENLPLRREAMQLQNQQAQLMNQQRQGAIDEDDRAKSVRNAGLIYNYATQLKSLPMEQRRTYLATIPEQQLTDIGFEPGSIQSMAIDDASISTVISQLEPIVQQGQPEPQPQQDPAELQTFNALTQGLGEQDIEEAKRIRLGLGSKRKGTRNINIGGVEHVLNLDTGVAEPVRVGGAGITSDTVAESESRIAGAKTRAIESQKDVQEFISEAVPKITAIQSNISNYDDVIAEIDAGARTGAIFSRLPSINEASKSLDNLRTRLGLDVVAMGKFGALSEGELKVALDSALPTNKSPKALRKWVLDKKVAQQKAADALRDAVAFLDGGGTMGELAQISRARDVEPEDAPTTTQSTEIKFLGFE